MAASAGLVGVVFQCSSGVLTRTIGIANSRPIMARANR
jgi:hypothetical protein